MKRALVSGYVFEPDTLRYGPPIPPLGEWYVAKAADLRCSEHPLDALEHAAGWVLHRSELAGDLQAEGNPPTQWRGWRRRILASIDARGLLREFARRCGLLALDIRGWDTPDVVRRYLETGDETLQASAWDAARYRKSAYRPGRADWYAVRAALCSAEPGAEDAARRAARYAVRAARALRPLLRAEFARRVKAAFTETAQ